MVMFPVVAIVISVIAGETVADTGTWIGTGLVIAGNVLVMRARDHAPGRAPVEEEQIPCPATSVPGSG